MKQKIIIKNFGPIEDVEMEIDDFTIFIGPQTSGKSTIAKSVFFFLSLRDELLTLLTDSFNYNNFNDDLDDFKNSIIANFYVYWGSNNEINLNMKFWYSEDCFISIDNTPKLSNVRISEKFTYLINDIIEFLKKQALILNEDKGKFLNSSELSIKSSQKSHILFELQNQVNNIFGFDGDLIFIPASRSILSVLTDQMHNIKHRDLDYLMRTFTDRINSLKGLMIGSDQYETDYFIKEGALDNETLNLMKELSQSVLQGSYYNDDEEGDKIRINKNKSIKLLFASSGQQEAVWIIQMIFLLMLNKEKVFIVIEEPEAHLFPEAQKNIINLITLLANVNDNQVFITTHSPYLLTSLNNLVYAYQVGQKHPEKVSKIVDKQLWLNPEKLQAYFVGGKDNKGKIRSIIDPDLKIIQSEEIDSASSINNQQYDQLFDLE